MEETLIKREASGIKIADPYMGYKASGALPKKESTSFMASQKRSFLSI